jgi:hypothetical protein
VHAETALVDVVSQARRALGRAALPSLAAAFRGDCNFPCTFLTLDPYRHVRQERLFVPFNLTLPEPGRVPSRTPRGFVYYSFMSPLFERVLLLLLRQAVYPCTFYAPSYSDWLESQDRSAEHEIRRTPLDPRELGGYRFCVHHGGLGIATTGAVVRVPQLLTPVNLEHAITARALAVQGAARVELPDSVQEWRRAEDVVRRLEATIALPMSLHEEFNVSSADAVPTVRAIHDTILGI